MAACRSGESAIAAEASMGIAGSVLAYWFFGSIAAGWRFDEALYKLTRLTWPLCARGRA